jgi:hypothetical protein
MRRDSSRDKPAPRKSARRGTKRAKIGRIFTGDEALHELFRERAAAVLDNAEIGEEEKQGVLAALACPCCGTGSMSFTVSMKPKRGKFVAD